MRREECSLGVVEASLVSAISLLLLWACMVLFVSHSLEISCLLIFLQGSLIYFPFSMNFENLLLLVLFYSLYIYIFPILNKENCLLLLDDLLEIIIHVVCDNYVLSLSLSTPNLPHGLWRKG